MWVGVGVYMCLHVYVWVCVCVCVCLMCVRVRLDSSIWRECVLGVCVRHDLAISFVTFLINTCDITRSHDFFFFFGEGVRS